MTDAERRMNADTFHGAYLTRAVTLCPLCETRRKRHGGRECFECWRAGQGFAPLPPSVPVIRATVDHITDDKTVDRPSARPVVRCRWPECKRRVVVRGCCQLHDRRLVTMAAHQVPAAEWPARWEALLAAKKKPRYPVGAPCRWPCCGRSSSSLGYCKRDRKRLRALGGTEDSNPDLLAVEWDERQLRNLQTWSDVGKANGGKARRRAA